jgi:hypothetical protein
MARDGFQHNRESNRFMNEINGISNTEMPQGPLDSQTDHEDEEIEYHTSGPLPAMVDLNDPRTMFQLRKHQKALFEYIEDARVSTDMSDVLSKAVQTIQSTLDVPLGYTVRQDLDSFTYSTGTGWDAAAVASFAAVESTQHMLETATMASTKAMRVLHANTKFSDSTFLHDHNIRSGITTRIPLSHSKYYGLLGAFSMVPRSFNKNEQILIDAVAAVCGMAITRLQHESRKVCDCAAMIQQCTRDHQQDLQEIIGSMSTLLLTRHEHLSSMKGTHQSDDDEAGGDSGNESSSTASVAGSDDLWLLSPSTSPQPDIWEPVDRDSFGAQDADGNNEAGSLSHLGKRDRGASSSRDTLFEDVPRLSDSSISNFDHILHVFSVQLPGN